MATEDCVEWAKIIKTCYIRRADDSPRQRLSEKTAAVGEEAQARFRGELAQALGIAPEEVDSYIERHLAETL